MRKDREKCAGRAGDEMKRERLRISYGDVNLSYGDGLEGKARRARRGAQQMEQRIKEGCPQFRHDELRGRVRKFAAHNPELTKVDTAKHFKISTKRLNEFLGDGVSWCESFKQSARIIGQSIEEVAAQKVAGNGHCKRCGWRPGRQFYRQGNGQPGRHKAQHCTG